MKVFMCDSDNKYFLNENDFNWCEGGELLRHSIFSNEERINKGFVGIKGGKSTSRVIVRNLNISEELFDELIYSSYREELDKIHKPEFHTSAEIDNEGNVTIKALWLSDIKFNVFDNIKTLKEDANKYEEGSVLIFNHETPEPNLFENNIEEYENI